MKPEISSQKLLSITRSKAKMYEYNLPIEHHITIYDDPERLFILTIGMLGDIVAKLNRHEITDDELQEFKKNLKFSAVFFDAYEQSELNKNLSPHTQLLGATAFYIADLPGSALVLSRRYDEEELFCEGVENLLIWLLRGDYRKDYGGSEAEIGPFVENCFTAVKMYFESGAGDEDLFNSASSLRTFAYSHGTPRQLLLVDCIVAVINRKHQNSSWNALPLYSDTTRAQWADMLGREGSIQELWPAQHLLGKADIFRGESAVVQMPTSSGKTKAVELIIRSAFFERGSLAIIVAPFRALCHEIRDDLSAAFLPDTIDVEELTDAMIDDFELNELLGSKKVVVVTPEKLLYVLRLLPEIIPRIDLVVFDEGHQFDSGKRGITFELLLTSLRMLLPENCQKVLISAVISNAASIGEWLNGHQNIVTNSNLLPSTKAIGFTSWKDTLGRLEYVSEENPDELEFFVPRVIERKPLAKRGKETSDRYFPEKNDTQSISIYLGLRLVENGGIAIFCGRKDSVTKICKTVSDLQQRNAIHPSPLQFSDEAEVAKLSYLLGENLGESSPVYLSSKNGIFTHQGDTPQGIRLAVEHAMRAGSIKFVVCTSTLAQGVNLPIRYLVVSGVRQGSERIKVRDFQNLVGRAGRAGLHTEGSILFADPKIFDKKSVNREKWRWNEAKELLDSINSEPCVSNLTSLFRPLFSDDEKTWITMEALDFTRAYIENNDAVSTWSDEILKLHEDKGFTKSGIERQIDWKAGIISAIESFLLSNWKVGESEFTVDNVKELAESTLAFHLADPENKAEIRNLFTLLANNISKSSEDFGRIGFFRRTLYGLHDARLIELWVDENISSLVAAESDGELVDCLWPLISQFFKNTTAKKINRPEYLSTLAKLWIEGRTYHELLSKLKESDVKLIWGEQLRNLTVEHVVNICEGAFSFDGALLIGATIEFIDQLDFEEKDLLIEKLTMFLKKIKYGLPSHATASVFELGFSDRVVAQDMCSNFNLKNEEKALIIQLWKLQEQKAKEVISKYPHYFEEKLNDLL